MTPAECGETYVEPIRERVVRDRSDEPMYRETDKREFVCRRPRGHGGDHDGEWESIASTWHAIWPVTS